MKKVFIYGKSSNLKNYQKAITRIGATPVISKRLTTALNCDCLLLAGGGDIYPYFYGKKEISCYDKNLLRDISEFALVKYFLSKNACILGICRGLQLLNVYFGGTLHQKINNFNLHFLPNQDCYHKIFVKEKGEISDILSCLKIVNSSHRQSIDRLANGFKIIASSNDGTIEAIRHEKFKIYAFQFHPERLNLPNLIYGLKLISTTLQL